MTTPAVFIDQRSTNKPTQSQVCEGRHGQILRCIGYEESTYDSFKRLIRPESGTSPVRPDGTRGPRGWDVTWGDGVMPCPYRVYRTKPDGRGEFLEYRTSTNLSTAFGNSWDRTLALVKADWLRRDIAGEFPKHLEHAARTKFLNKLLDKQMNLGESLAEMGQTVSLVKSLATDLQDFVHESAKAIRRPVPYVMDALKRMKKIHKRGDLRRWARNKAERSLVDRWLQFQFGVMPVVYDIMATTQAMDVLLEDQKPFRLKIRAGSSAEWSTTGKFEGAGGNAIQPVLHQAECHISAYYDMDISRVRKSQQLGLGNPLLLGWELLPFSWMVDYAIGIGDWLETLIPVDGAHFVEGSMTRVWRVRQDGVAQFELLPQYTQVSGFNNHVIQVSGGRMSRQVLTGNVWPAARPVVKTKLGLTQLANTLAGLVKLGKMTLR